MDLKEVLARKHWIFDLDGTLTVAVHAPWPSGPTR